MGVCSDICSYNRKNNERKNKREIQEEPKKINIPKPDPKPNEPISNSNKGLRNYVDISQKKEEIGEQKEIKKDSTHEKAITEKNHHLYYNKKEEINSDIDKKVNDSIDTKVTVKINADCFCWDNKPNLYYNLNIIDNLKGILKLLFLKFISKNTTNEKIMKIKNKNLIQILQILNKDLELINSKGVIEKEKYLSKDVQTILKEKQGSNIIEYAKYINYKVQKDELNEIKELINNQDYEQKEKVFHFLNNIYKYNEFNTFFEEEFTKAQLESIFDFSIINLVMLDNKNFSNYEKAKNNCPNCIKRVLFHGTQIDPASKIISSEFKYTRKAFYGMGIYFTDNLDYITFYSGGEKFENRRINFNKIFPPNTTFTFIASEIFYNKNLFKHIRDNSYYVKELDHFPTYEEISRKYKAKMVPKNGIHFITVKSEHGQILKDSIASVEERKNGKFIVNEYVITELEQICPLYAIKIKRNEYFLLWRDLNFKGKKFYFDYLKERELYANGIAKMNIYIESNTEKALKFIYKRRFNKMILITSIGLDLSGKKFIEVARKILGSNIIVLIYSSNKNHLRWIQNYPNLLYTNNATIYQKYIKNYNEEGLKELKKEVEDNYKIKLLDFTNDFLTYPLYIDSQKYSNINVSGESPYIREVIIYNSNLNATLIMNDNGIIEIVRGKKKSPNWDVTLVDNEITLFSNGYYLGYDEESKKIVSDKYMKRWNCVETCRGDYIIKTGNNLFISIDNNNNLIVKENIDDNNLNSTFQLIDID